MKAKRKQSALCVGPSFSLRTLGYVKWKKHEETAKHKKLEKEVKNNSALNTDNGRVKLLLPQPQPVSLEEKVTRAEIIQAFHVVNANLPFLSADTDAERFRMQFPDSEIAKHYQQSRSKLGYVIEYGIAPVLMKNLKTDILCVDILFITGKIRKKKQKRYIYLKVYNLISSNSLSLQKHQSTSPPPGKSER